MCGAFAGKECSGQCLWQVSSISDNNNYFRCYPTKDLSHGYLYVLNTNQKSVFRKILPLIRYEDNVLALCAYVVWHDLPMTKVQLLSSYEIKEIHTITVHTGLASISVGHLWQRGCVEQILFEKQFLGSALCIYIYILLPLKFSRTFRLCSYTRFTWAWARLQHSMWHCSWNIPLDLLHWNIYFDQKPNNSVSATRNNNC